MNLKLIIVFVIYLTIFISGLIITIALGMTKSNFDGYCILYVDATWTDISHFQISSFGASSTCEYVIYLPLVDSIIYPFIMLLIIGYVIVQSYRGNVEAEKGIKFLPVLLINVVSFILTFIAACIVSSGRRAMCSAFVDGRTERGYRDATCYDAQNLRWSNSNFRTSSFVRDIILAEVVLWISLIWWLLLIVPEAIRFWRNRGNLSTATSTTTAK